MAAISMTGFGRGCAEAEGVRLEVELAAVNRKAFDFAFSAPSDFARLEATARDAVNGRISRGRVQCLVSAFSAEGGVGGYDVNAIREKAEQMRRLAELVGVPNDLTLSTLLAFPEVTQSPSQRLGEAALSALLTRALGQALDALCAMRTTEGQALSVDLLARLDTLRTLRAKVAEYAPEVPKRHQETLMRRIAELGIAIPVDDTALAREVALCAERWDVTEELTRLEAHFDHFVSLLRAAEPCGRKLDFLCQEMNREANTIGSKANDAAIAAIVIEMKALIETVREQVQNLE